jgi:hypothetical protein
VRHVLKKARLQKKTRTTMFWTTSRYGVMVDYWI